MRGIKAYWQGECVTILQPGTIQTLVRREFETLAGTTSWNDFYVPTDELVTS